MPYETNGMLTTDKREVAIDTTWDTQTDWTAYQSASAVQINNGVVSLAEGIGVPTSTVLHLVAEDYDDSAGEWTGRANGHTFSDIGDPTLSSNAVGGHPAVSYNGSGDASEGPSGIITGTTGRTFFMVVKTPDGGTDTTHFTFAGRIPVSGGSAGAWDVTAEMGIRVAGGYRLWPAQSDEYVIETVSHPASATTADVQAWRNSALLSPSDTNTSSTLDTASFPASIAATHDDSGGYMGYMQGGVAEILATDTELSATERQEQEQRLANKYGITLA